MLAPITVTARRVANLQPASSYASTATALRFDPQINLQARGLPEGQADITVRGGLFENTGFRLGAITISDPQTGHYAVEIPIDPGMLSSPEVLTDFDNGLNSFNASIATVSYGFAPVASGGRLYAGLGTDSLYHASVAAAPFAGTGKRHILRLGLSAAGFDWRRHGAIRRPRVQTLFQSTPVAG